MNPATERVLAALTTAGVSAAAERVVELPDSARTAALAAAQLHCPVGAIANSLVFAIDKVTDEVTDEVTDNSANPTDQAVDNLTDARPRPLLILASGAHKVDVGTVATLLDVAGVRRADPAFVKEATGYAIGGVPPVGHRQPLTTLVDEELAAYDVVWAAAGTPHTVFRTTYAELITITGGWPARVR